MQRLRYTLRRHSLPLGGGLGTVVLAGVIGCGGLVPRAEVDAAGAGGQTSVADGSGGATSAQGGTAGASQTVTSATTGGAGGAGGIGGTGGAGGTGGTSIAYTGVPSRLEGSPLAFTPTATELSLNAVVADGDPALLRVRMRAAGTTAWSAPTAPAVPAVDVARWTLTGLDAGTRYEYQVFPVVDEIDASVEVDGAAPDAGSAAFYQGSAVTQRPRGTPFSFALVTDSHIGADLAYGNQGSPAVLRAVAAAVDASEPDFIVHLGDMLDFHEFGFNDPPPDKATARAAYLNYRILLGDAIGHAAHFATIGNWEGENGTYTADEIERSQSQRFLYVPGPSPSTYPESGSRNQDYYAFTWGDALFVVLNVMTYTTTEHLLGSPSGLPDDWTLGAEQLAWLDTTLANASTRWRFLFIHHTVGGAAGDEMNSGYGRGGGQAAYVGEQSKVHALMLRYGAQIFFYGHDHVFTDMTVDGIHYTLPGSAGAPWTFSQAETGYAQSWPDSGWARVRVDSDHVQVELIALDGKVLYAYTLPE